MQGGLAAGEQGAHGAGLRAAPGTRPRFRLRLWTSIWYQIEYQQPQLHSVNLSESITPITQLKQRSADLIRQVRESGKPIVITQNGKAAAILQDVATWQRQQDAIAMLKLAVQGSAELDAGEGIGHGEVSARVRAKVRELRGG